MSTKKQNADYISASDLKSVSDRHKLAQVKDSISKLTKKGFIVIKASSILSEDSLRDFISSYNITNVDGLVIHKGE